jgi:tRNA dimethylallyltransferase
MSLATAERPLVAVVGPTASGKSALGVWLGEQFGGEVLACDSTQLYRGFDIGTAKPGHVERHGIPHHLIDVLAPLEEATAGGYRQMALAVLEDLRRRGNLPILTVGTGLYLRALLEGLADVPQRSEELRQRLRASAEEHGPGYLHRLLKRLDPETAGKIAAPDEQKLIRAIEVCVLAQRPVSEVHRTGRSPLTGWRPLRIGLMPPRDALYERIHARTDAMLAQGWIEEVRGLMASGLPENAKPFNFIGYRELREVQRGAKKLEEARAAIQQATRQYAKRQITWFRKDSTIHWIAGFGDESSAQAEARDWLHEQGLPGSPPGSGARIIP